MWRVRASPIRGAALLGLVLLVLAGCGGHGERELELARRARCRGRRCSTSAGCGGCHTLQAAKSKGTVGPDLDQLRPDAQTVERQVRNGGVGMPSFSKKLNEVRDQPGRRVRVRVDPLLDDGRLRRRRLQARRHEDRGLQGDRLPLLRAGVREHLVQGQPEDGPRSVRQGHQDARADRARLPPHRPRDRRRSALTLPRQRRPGVRRRPAELHLRLLPRHPRTRLPRSRPEQARLLGAQVLRQPRGPQVRVHRLPVRPRARTRADDLHRLRPARCPCTRATSSPRAGMRPAARAASSWRTTSPRTASCRAG